MVDKTLTAWITRGRQREAILKAFSEPMTPARIHRKSKHFNPKISLNNCSDVLREFRKRGVAVCTNKDARVGRIYELTKQGENVRNALLNEVK